MARWMLGLILGVIAMAAVPSLPSAAASDGLPLPSSITPSKGVPGPHGTRFVTTGHGGGSTLVREHGPNGTLQSATVRGELWIPAVAVDGSPGGLSADGNRLVLVQGGSRVPRGPTRLVILDARNLRVVQRLTLRGAFSFDAISPDGSRLYLIQYLSTRDPTRYAVRAYDTVARRMLPDPIVDPDEHAGEMRGLPMTRAMSLDGRWAYTLYDGGGGEPFVHALDTAEGRAECVDLDGLVKPRDALGAVIGFNPDGSELTVAAHRESLAVIDASTLEASAPPPPQAPATGEEGASGGFPWVLTAAAAGVGVIGVGAVIGLRRRHGSGLAAPEA